MPRFVVLLRGVNVGKGNRVAMAEFKRLLEDLGCCNVKTLLNSGNAAFGAAGRSAARHAAAIAAALREQLDLDVPVIVKSAAELAAIVEASPIHPAEEQHSRCFVAFAPDASTLEPLAALRPLVKPGERFAITPEAAYLHCPDGVLQSKVGEALLGKAGRRITTRNWATVLKLAALVAEEKG